MGGVVGGWVGTGVQVTTVTVVVIIMTDGEGVVKDSLEIVWLGVIATVEAFWQF